MAEKRYISTEYLGKCETCRNLGSRGCNTYCDHGEEYRPNLTKIPTADVVEVVRCKDCIHKRNGFCEHHDGLFLPEDNNYCSYGVRKDTKRMDIHTATEIAYKNGYADGMKDFAERLTKICDAPYWCVWLSEIEDLLEEMLKSKELKEQTASEIASNERMNDIE